MQTNPDGDKAATSFECRFHALTANMDVDAVTNGVDIHIQPAQTKPHTFSSRLRATDFFSY